MSQNVQEQPAGIKQLTFVIDTALVATADPYVRFYAKTAMTPLSCAIHPLTTFDFGDADEAYTLSVEDDTVKISTDNAAITTAQATPIECTFAAGTQIAKDSVVEIIITIAGTTPSIPAYSLVIFTYLEGGI